MKKTGAQKSWRQGSQRNLMQHWETIKKNKEKKFVIKGERKCLQYGIRSCQAKKQGKFDPGARDVAKTSAQQVHDDVFMLV